MTDWTKVKGFKPIKRAEKVEVIRAKENPWNQDPKGFFLIKPNYKDKTIHAGFCTNDCLLRYEIIGKRPQEIYHTIAKLGLISLYEHAAYLGKELKKVELAIKHNLKYVQDKDIGLGKKRK